MSFTYKDHKTDLADFKLIELCSSVVAETNSEGQWPGFKSLFYHLSAA